MRCRSCARFNWQFARIEQGGEGSPTPVPSRGPLWARRIAQGATFLERYGTSLEDVVREACATDSVHMDEGGSNEAAAICWSIADRSRMHKNNVVGRTIRAATKSKRVDGAGATWQKKSQEEAP